MPRREPREVTESFRIERVLKSSRSGIVFRALDPASGEAVAIKLIPPPAAAALAGCQARFVALAELLTLLQPRGVPPLSDFGFTPDGSAFLVMELVEGVRLDRIEELSPARVVGIALGVVETLATLAGKGIYHGNISPDNVLVGPGDRSFVTGLGTAALRPPGAIAGVVLEGDSAEFAPPERFDPEVGGVADWRGDLYSLALSVCALLKAEITPADAPAPAVRLPFEVAKGLRDPNVLRTALEQSLRRAPAERPASFDVLRDAFRGALGAPAPAQAATASPAPASAEAAPARVAAPPAPPQKQAPPASRKPSDAAAGAAPRGASRPAAAPPDSVSSSGLEWEEPEGAPAWLQESSPAFVLEKPEPRVIEPPAEPVRDEREDTNPVPLVRKAELPLKPKVEPPAVVPTVGAPQPLPTPALAAPPVPSPAPPPAPERPPVVAADVVPQPRVIALAPEMPPLPAAPAVAAGPGAAPAADREAPPASAPPAPPLSSVHSDRRLESTPPTGSYEVPPAAGPPAPAPVAAAPVASPDPGVAPADVEAAVEAPAEAQPRTEPVPSPPAAKPPSSGSPRRLLVAALASAAVVIVGAVGVFVGMQVLRSRQSVPVVPTPAPARPRPTAVPQPGVPPAVLASLLAAEQAVTAGDLNAAQAALDAITADDELALGPADLGRLTRIRAATNSLRLDGILDDLRTGLGSGNLKLLREAVRRVSREDEAALTADPDTSQTLDEARRAVNLLGLAGKAQQAGSDAQLLQHASALLDLVPRSSQAAELREKAASGLERDADALVQHGRFAEAEDRLDTLARYWSARPGIAQRVEKVRAAQAADQRLAALLAQAEQAERDRQPDRGLELLRSTTPPPYYEERFRQARGRLQALLQEMDSDPPVVELSPATKLEYQKNKPFVLTVRITDDHGVRSASMFVRVKGGERFQEEALVRGSGGEWRGEITPVMHQNKAVELYIVAGDQSGHTGQAGSAEAPLQLKKKWSLFGM
jgi:serine/threonine protein kinase